MTSDDKRVLITKPFIMNFIKKKIEIISAFIHRIKICCLIDIAKYTKYNILATHDVPPIINVVYEDIFGFKTNGVFLEIGAFDGETASFTCFLADIGWTGHYIDPMNRYLEKCAQRHKMNNVFCHNFFIGDVVGESRMYDYGPFSRKSIIEDFKTNPIYSKETGESVKVNCLTMDGFLKKQEIYHEIDLMVIDVEDGEINVLKSFSLLGKEYNPTAIIIETTHENETKSILNSAGYVQYCSFDTDDPFTKNLIFVSPKRADEPFPLLNKMRKMKLMSKVNHRLNPSSAAPRIRML